MSLRLVTLCCRSEFSAIQPLLKLLCAMSNSAWWESISEQYHQVWITESHLNFKRARRSTQVYFSAVLCTVMSTYECAVVTSLSLVIVILCVFSYIGLVCLFRGFFLCVCIFSWLFHRLCDQYQCKWLPGKTPHLQNDLLCVELYTLRHIYSSICINWCLRYANVNICHRVIKLGLGHLNLFPLINPCTFCAVKSFCNARHMTSFGRRWRLTSKNQDASGAMEPGSYSPLLPQPGMREKREFLACRENYLWTILLLNLLLALQQQHHLCVSESPRTFHILDMSTQCKPSLCFHRLPLLLRDWYRISNTISHYNAYDTIGFTAWAKVFITRPMICAVLCAIAVQSYAQTWTVNSGELWPFCLGFCLSFECVCFLKLRLVYLP